jgi:peptidoglycan hydrolase CwlO-like protein
MSHAKDAHNAIERMTRAFEDENDKLRAQVAKLTEERDQWIDTAKRQGEAVHRDGELIAELQGALTGMKNQQAATVAAPASREEPAHWQYRAVSQGAPGKWQYGSPGRYWIERDAADHPLHAGAWEFRAIWWQPA